MNDDIDIDELIEAIDWCMNILEGYYDFWETDGEWQRKYDSIEQMLSTIVRKNAVR